MLQVHPVHGPLPQRARLLSVSQGLDRAPTPEDLVVPRARPGEKKTPWHLAAPRGSLLLEAAEIEPSGKVHWMEESRSDARLANVIQGETGTQMAGSWAYLWPEQV